MTIRAGTINSGGGGGEGSFGYWILEVLYRLNEQQTLSLHSFHYVGCLCGRAVTRTVNGPLVLFRKDLVGKDAYNDSLCLNEIYFLT